MTLKSLIKPSGFIALVLVSYDCFIQLKLNTMKLFRNVISLNFLFGLATPTFAVVDNCPMGDCGGGDLPIWMAIPIFGAFVYIYFVLCWRVTLKALLVGFVTYLAIDAVFGGESGVLGIVVGFFSWFYFSHKEEEDQKNRESDMVD